MLSAGVEQRQDSLFVFVDHSDQIRAVLHPGSGPLYSNIKRAGMVVFTFHLNVLSYL